MNNKRVTIYDLAKAINLSPSYISKALNNHPSVGDKIINITLTLPISGWEFLKR